LFLLAFGLELVFSDIFPTIAPDFYTNAGEPKRISMQIVSSNLFFFALWYLVTSMVN